MHAHIGRVIYAVAEGTYSACWPLRRCIYGMLLFSLMYSAQKASKWFVGLQTQTLKITLMLRHLNSRAECFVFLIARESTRCVLKLNVRESDLTQDPRRIQPCCTADCYHTQHQSYAKSILEAGVYLRGPCAWSPWKRKNIYQY